MNDPQPSSTPPSAPSGPDVRRRLIEEKLQRHRKYLESLDRDARRVPWLGALALGALPAGYFWGVTIAALVVVGTVFLVGSAYYLIWGHRAEYVQKIAELQSEQRRL